MSDSSASTAGNNRLAAVAPAFVAVAHDTVWATVATVGPDHRPRTRILHPIWEWDGERLVGWVGTGPTPVKKAALDANPVASVSYWSPSQDTCSAEVDVTWHADDETRTRIWELFKATPEPLGYDPAIIPFWDGPTSEAFAVLRLDPYRLRVMPGSLMRGEPGEVLLWSRP